jgi:hypothetical protein
MIGSASGVFQIWWFKKRLPPYNNKSLCNHLFAIVAALSQSSLSQLYHNSHCRNFITILSVTALSQFSLSQLYHNSQCHSFITILSVTALSQFSLSQLYHNSHCHSFITILSVTAFSQFSLSQLYHNSQCRNFIAIHHVSSKQNNIFYICSINFHTILLKF